jgi:conjugal transfer pilus assembly protein TraU
MKAGTLLTIAFMVPLGMCVLRAPLEAKCPGKLVNPLTDICWTCLFPITIGGVSVTGGGEDTPNAKNPLCFCPKPGIPVPVPGIRVSFWEPVRLVDVTRTPYCLVNMGGIQVAGGPLQGAGSVATKGGKHALKHSFYQVHWYVYPVIYWLELLTDFVCLEKGEFDVAYLTELDPLWHDDETAFILNPEASLFANPVTQRSCAADCVAATSGFPSDALFWCSGCQGGIYPLTGSVAHHVGGVQASLLLTSRMIAKLHREGLLWGYSGEEGLCGKFPMPLIKKSQYKVQMTFPIPSTDRCDPLGRSEALWGGGREFPKGGEDFGYLIWRKRSCCLW